MALVFPEHKLVVLQVPRTGCRWRNRAIPAAIGSAASHPPEVPGHDHRHAIPAQLPVDVREGYRRVVYVRRPDRWLASYWSMRTSKRNWHRTWPTWLDENLDASLRDARGSFEEFAAAYVDRTPGLISRVFDSYIEPGSKRATCVCRQENIVKDTRAALKRLKIPFDSAALDAVPPRFVSDGSEGRDASLSDATRALLLSVEPAMRYYRIDKEGS